MFSLPRSQHAHGLWSQQAPSSISTAAWISAPLWLHGSFFSIFILTGQFYDIFSSTGFASQRQHALVKLPALSFHKATSWHLPGLQRSLTNPAAYSPSFYSEQMLAGPLVLLTCLLAWWKEIPLSKVGHHCGPVRRHWGVCASLSQQFGGQGYLVLSRILLRVSIGELIAAAFNR